jgi:hypothetical protein
MVRALVLVFARASLLAAQSPARCDRAGLEGWLDRYVDAVVAHAPSRMPFAQGVKFTKNGQRLQPGDGTWRTVTARGGCTLKMSNTDRLC